MCQVDGQSSEASVELMGKKTVKATKLRQALSGAFVCHRTVPYCVIPCQSFLVHPVGTFGHFPSVHQTEIKTDGYRSLAEGEAVEFEMTNDRGRDKAVNVTGASRLY